MSKDHLGYVAVIGDNLFWGSEKGGTQDIAKAKVIYSRQRALELLETAKAEYPDAYLIEVPVDKKNGRSMVNGIPQKHVRSRSAVRRGVWARYGGRCAYCGVPIKLHTCHMDAYYPDKGYEPENMMPACDSCYLRKKGKSPAEFQKYIESCYIKVRKHPFYAYARRFGLIVEPNKGVTFYFMTPEGQAQAEANKKRKEE